MFDFLLSGKLFVLLDLIGLISDFARSFLMNFVQTSIPFPFSILSCFNEFCFFCSDLVMIAFPIVFEFDTMPPFPDKFPMAINNLSIFLAIS